MSQDKMQQQRFELKYKISEETALRVRDFVSSYLIPDEFAEGKPNFSYAVHSLYLDSDDMRLYWDTINGNKNRFKLRLRYYDDNPHSPVFFEIKRRMNNCILKQRGGVRHEAVRWLLAGHIPEASHLVSKETKALVALLRFSQLMGEMGASPKAHIFYMREAWMGLNDNTVRVTLDREIGCDPHFSTEVSTHVENPAFAFRPQVVLELKFTNRFPVWFEDLVRSCDLVLTGAAKYVDGVAACGESLFYGLQPELVEEMKSTMKPELEQNAAGLPNDVIESGLLTPETNNLINKELNHG
jgi:SPX domain protein involved in polyphosphate accumulation